MRTRKLLAAAAALLVLGVPVGAWAFIKQIRVVAPELMGLHCSPQGVCVDDLSRMAEAVTLRHEAIEFVESNIGQLKRPPRAVFCSTSQCARDFGFTKQFAFNVGTFGMALSPKGWEPFFVRHELIHHLQDERLGIVDTWFFKPSWFIEGMAYSLSEDPRRPLPAPLEEWTTRFEQWRSAIGTQDIWQAASTEK